MFHKKIIVICGPTGIGKTAFAIGLANRFDGEIIGADSMQIYKYMDIGTAKPDKEEKRQARHHLVDIAEPDENFDAGLYASAADSAIQDIFSRGKLPIVAGGTGFYIQALLYGLFRSKPADAAVLEHLTSELEEKGNKHLYDRLLQCDPEAANKIHPNDTFRVIRALEVFEITKIPISQQQKSHEFKKQKFKTLKFGLTMEREKLYQRINKRVDMMLDQGLLKEVESLHNKGYSLDLKPMQSIGYKHMGLFLKGEVDWEEAVRLLKRDTRRYAKRQFTWFNKDKEIVWLEPDQIEPAVDLVKNFLT
ncbi:MAG: tRNA (adenosine(37)-N6)-dimethylallyltransferase MiaA [Desulfobacteraceae bacterium]|nr:tRNA (adenosine(37)-N6)-dimethylallyltransferase MiaA [Desulfobacteraceae bacterium]